MKNDEDGSEMVKNEFSQLQASSLQTHIASFANAFTPPPTNDGVENFIKMQLLNCILIWNISQVTRFVVAEKINLFWELCDGKAICLRYSLLHRTWKKILHSTLSEVATHLTIIFHRNLAEEWSPAKPLTQSKHMAQSSWRSSRAFSAESILQTLCRCRARGSNCNRSHSAGQALL